MANRFLRKYKLNSNVLKDIHDIELVNPINKNLKSTQVYLDSSVPSSPESFHYRLHSQSPKSSASVVLEPIRRPPRLSSSIVSETCPDEHQERFNYIGKSKVHSSHYDKKPYRFEQEFDIKKHSNINYSRISRPPKHIFF